VLKPALESKENIKGAASTQPIQNLADAPLHVSSEEDLSQIDEDSHSSDLKTPT
jgi:hypothetical protein